MTTPAAVETIGALLKKELERAADDYASNPVRYNGPDWWQLSDEEAFVFDINPDRWPVLMTLYHFYQSLVGVTDGFSIEEENDWELAELEALKDATRTAHPEWGISPETRSVTGFQAFAKHYAPELPFRESHACWDKMFWWDVRGGVMIYRDEA